MRVLYFANNWLGWRVLEWLKSQDDEIVGVVAHPEDKAKYRDEICETSRLPEHLIFDGSRLGESKTLEAIRGLGAQTAISVLFGYLLRPALLRQFDKGCLNLHLSFLPFNRGKNPNVWSIVEKSPAGVTLHYMDDKLDTGPIVAREQLEVDMTDTGRSLYRKLEEAGLELFKRTWPKVVAGEAKPFPQETDRGSFHLGQDLASIDRIDLEKRYRAEDLINIVRARTFPPYQGAYIEAGGRKVFLKLELYEEGQIVPGPGDEPLTCSRPGTDPRPAK